MYLLIQLCQQIHNLINQKLEKIVLELNQEDSKKRGHIVELDQEIMN